jgi:hypothetical protein
MLNSLFHTAIDSIQTGNKYLVTNTVKYEPLADMLITYIDSQTSYTKSFIDTAIKSTTDFSSLVTSKDFAKEVVEAYTPTVMKAASRKAK